MTTKYVSPGAILTRANPGGSAADQIVTIGKFKGVTLNGSATEPTGTLQQVGVEGVFTLPKLAEGIAQGTQVYAWPTGVGAVATTGGFPIGIAWENLPTAATEGAVKLGPVPVNALVTGGAY